METAQKLQTALSEEIDGTVKKTMSLGNATRRRFQQLLGDWDFGIFGNIMVSVVIIYIIYRIGISILTGFDYSNKIEFIRRSFYTWTILLTIMVIYASLSK